MEEHFIPHTRKSIRLEGFDYSNQEAYFVTICSFRRKCLFGVIKDEKVTLSLIGKHLEIEWNKTPKLRKNVILDKFVIMPNHFHAIIMILNPGSGTMHCATTEDNFKEKFSLPRPDTLSSIIRCFKASVTRRIRKKYLIPDTQRLWQRNYYEHIIRNDTGLYAIQEYIQNNPIYWSWDKNNPKNKSKLYSTTIE